jgi:predicted Zn-dependent peptidase
VQLTSRRGLEQVHVCFGTEGPSQASQRRYAANLLDIVLGGGMSSRLFQEVREKRGLAYSIASSLNSYRLGGYETISAACAPRNLARLLEVTLRELARLKRDGVRPRELAWAKENLKGNMILSLESTVSRASQQARHEFYFGRSIPAEELIAGVERVTAADVGEEARRLLDGHTLSLAVVGNVPRLPIKATDLVAAL